MDSRTMCPTDASLAAQKTRDALFLAQQEQQRAALARIEQVKRDAIAAEQNLRDIAHRLRSSGSPGAQPRRKHVRDKQTIPGWTRWKPVYEPISPGWNVGEFDWNFYTPALTGTFERDASSGVRKAQTWVTVEGKVETDPGGYTVFSGNDATTPTLEAMPKIHDAFAELARRLLG